MSRSCPSSPLPHVSSPRDALMSSLLRFDPIPLLCDQSSTSPVDDDSFGRGLTSVWAESKRLSTDARLLEPSNLATFNFYLHGLPPVHLDGWRWRPAPRDRPFQACGLLSSERVERTRVRAFKWLLFNSPMSTTSGCVRRSYPNPSPSSRTPRRSFSGSTPGGLMDGVGPHRQRLLSPSSLGQIGEPCNLEIDSLANPHSGNTLALLLPASAMANTTRLAQPLFLSSLRPGSSP